MLFSHPFFALYAAFDNMDIYIIYKARSSKKKYSLARWTGSKYWKQGAKITLFASHCCLFRFML